MNYQRIAEAAEKRGIDLRLLWSESEVQKLWRQTRPPSGDNRLEVIACEHVTACLACIAGANNAMQWRELFLERANLKHPRWIHRPGLAGVLAITELASGALLRSVCPSCVHVATGKSRQLVWEQVGTDVRARCQSLTDRQRKGAPSLLHLGASATRLFVEGSCKCAVILERQGRISPRAVEVRLRECMWYHDIAEFSGGLDRWETYRRRGLEGILSALLE